MNVPAAIPVRPAPIATTAPRAKISPPIPAPPANPGATATKLPRARPLLLQQDRLHLRRIPPSLRNPEPPFHLPHPSQLLPRPASLQNSSPPSPTLANPRRQLPHQRRRQQNLPPHLFQNPHHPRRTPVLRFRFHPLLPIAHSRSALPQQPPLPRHCGPAPKPAAKPRITSRVST